MKLKRTVYTCMAFLFIFSISTSTYAQLYTKLQWMAEDSLWGVFVKTDSTIQPSQNILLGSGQITVVAPTGFEIGGMTSYMGTWVQNARANHPEENPEMDYISFGIRISEPVTELGLYDEVLILTFSTVSSDCPSALFLIENDDPFATNNPNSLNTNPGNDLQMVDLGNGRAIYEYKGNYNLDDWNCDGSTNITTSLKDFQRTQLVKVFPNPFNEKLVFELIEKGKSPNYQIKLFDNLGRAIRVEKMINTRLDIEVQEKSAFFYYEILDLDTNEIIETGKLVKR